MEHINVKTEFGATVKRLRTSLGLSQEALAERADLHRTYITDIERGTRNLSLESIQKLAGALEVSIGSLFVQAEARQPSASPGDFANLANEVVDLLLVEDDPKDIELTLEAFKAARLANRIQVVRDGATALDFLLGRDERALDYPKHLPQVVLLDLNLPRVHGLEVLRRIKTEERTRSIHVVVLTVSHKDEHIRRALQLGAEAYIVKPVGFVNFSEVIPKLNCSWTILKSRKK